jgi:chromosome segregation ATPase
MTTVNDVMDLVLAYAASCGESNCQGAEVDGFDESRAAVEAMAQERDDLKLIAEQYRLEHNALEQELEAVKKHCKWADDEIEQLNTAIHRTSIKYCERIAERDALQVKLEKQEPVAYRAWFDADNGARWLFSLWPEEERLEVDWQPLYAAAGAAHKEQQA